MHEQPLKRRPGRLPPGKVRRLPERIEKCWEGHPSRLLDSPGFNILIWPRGPRKMSSSGISTVPFLIYFIVGMKYLGRVLEQVRFLGTTSPGASG